MSTRLNWLILSAMAIMVLFQSCEDEVVIPNEEELITTLIFTLTPVGGGADVVFQFQDLDGDGGTAPVITAGALTANTDYTGSLRLLNETESPAEEITEEVEEEGTEHQFFFDIEAGLNLVIAYDDQDDDLNPVGLETTVSAGDVSTGELTITLRHEPDKFGANVSTGDITNAGGETDIEVTFDVVIN